MVRDSIHYFYTAVINGNIAQDIAPCGQTLLLACRVVEVLFRKWVILLQIVFSQQLMRIALSF